MLRAVIFDMDGLLIDSEPLWVRAEMEVFAAFGVHLTEEDCARTKGLRIDDVIAYWQTRRGFTKRSEPKDPEDAPAIGASDVELVREIGREVETRLISRVIELVTWEGRALPGIAPAIAAATKSDRRIALASSSPLPIIVAALERLNLTHTFDLVQSAQTESYGKPHPAIFLRTAEQLGVSALECVVIEDSLNGIIAAKAARMGCIAVPFDHPTHDARFVLADAVVASLADITSELLERVSG